LFVGIPSGGRQDGIFGIKQGRDVRNRKDVGFGSGWRCGFGGRGFVDGMSFELFEGKFVSVLVVGRIGAGIAGTGRRGLRCYLWAKMVLTNAKCLEINLLRDLGSIRGGTYVRKD